jgi:hypothetical protein
MELFKTAEKQPFQLNGSLGLSGPTRYLRR